MDQVAQVCFEEIMKRSERPLFVGIGGDSGCGKSYLKKLLVKRLTARKIPYTIIDHDEFLISRVDREPMKTIFLKTVYTRESLIGKSSKTCSA